MNNLWFNFLLYINLKKYRNGVLSHLCHEHINLKREKEQRLTVFLYELKHTEAEELFKLEEEKEELNCQ